VKNNRALYSVGGGERERKPRFVELSGHFCLGRCAFTTSSA